MSPVEIVYPPRPIIRLKIVARSDTRISRLLDIVDRISSAR